MKIALFGGCFNPIHYGHLILAQEARERFNLGRVVFIPSGKPPHKVVDLAPAIRRKKMVQLAIRDNQCFSSSSFEIKKKGKSYSYQTIEFFKKKYPRDEIFFLAGSDTLFEIDTWKKGHQILKLCPFLIGLRPGFSFKKVEKEILKTVITFPITAVDVSGKDIRHRVRQGKSIKYLVPEEVEKYIYENCLYQNTET